MRSIFLITADQGDHAAERADTGILRESLETGSHALSKHLNGALVAELHLELSSSGTDLSDHNSGVVGVANNDGTDAIGDRVDVSNTVRDDQFIGNLLLGAHDNAVIASDSDGILSSSLNGLEGVLNLVDSAVWREYLHQLIHASHRVYIFTAKIIKN